MSIKFKRMFAFIIDWNIFVFPIVCAFQISMNYFLKSTKVHPLVPFLGAFAILGTFAAFVLRDVIFKGRSLGKRLFGLYVYDKGSLEQASLKQRFLKNIFFFIYPIDGIVLLATGETIGDSVANTIVTTKQNLEARVCETQVNMLASKPKKAKRIIAIVVIVIAVLIAFIGMIQVVLNTQKDSEEYKVAYSYFVESETFKKLNVDESKIRFNQYSLNTYKTANSSSVSQTVRIGFMVKFEFFEVVCHKENGVWQVCDECTLFE